jgi:molybdopterin-guanine dinucleotide biosynthesis protein A
VKVAVVILAGGEGKRIGGNKPLRLLGGKSLLERVMRYASGISKCCAVAVRDETQIGNIEIPVVRDDPEIEGPLGGLVAALRFARDEGRGAVLTIPADMPFLPTDLADRLVDSIGQSRAVIACSGGHQHPVCGLWRTEALDAFPEYLASGRRSLRGFAGVVGYVAIDWPVDPLDPFFNINSEQDLAEAERLLA